MSVLSQCHPLEMKTLLVWQLHPDASTSSVTALGRVHIVISFYRR